MDPNALRNISYGMYIVASFNKEGAMNGQIANAAMQITSDPATIALSINKKNLTHEFIESSSVFSLSVLDESTPLVFIGKFGFRSGRTEDKFKGVNFKKLDSGCPAVIDNSVAYLAARVINKLDCSTHTVFLGEIIDSAVLKSGRPMTYDYYHQVKRGTTPAAAPTFVKEEMPGGKADTMQKYRCVVCNYIYDPAAGDPDNGVQPGTPFDKIPDTWVCPVCGADKTQFVKSSD